MTVGELLELLKDADPATRVFVQGPDDGLNDPTLQVIPVWENMGGGGYSGQHRQVEDWHEWDDTYDNLTPIEGVLLRRY